MARMLPNLRQGVGDQGKEASWRSDARFVAQKRTAKSEHLLLPLALPTRLSIAMMGPTTRNTPFLAATFAALVVATFAACSSSNSDKPAPAARHAREAIRRPTRQHATHASRATARARSQPPSRTVPITSRVFCACALNDATCYEGCQSKAQKSGVHVGDPKHLGVPATELRERGAHHDEHRGEHGCRELERYSSLARAPPF